MSSRIPVGRGVKQGGPMSPMLFNAVVDMILGEVDRSIGIKGYSASKIKCNYIAFANDHLLMSTTELECKCYWCNLKEQWQSWDW